MGGWGCQGFALEIASLAIGSNKHRNRNKKYRIFCSDSCVSEVSFDFFKATKELLTGQ
ncbi:MAG: hypothetical protein Q8942_09305 [Bacillota bacterium]|nr:hypothetical protein [Bacillota bacterium]